MTDLPDSSSLPPPKGTSRQLDELFTQGMPATLDSDVGDRIALSRLLDDTDFDTSLRYASRAALLRQWLEVPSVTLEQATWILLGRDPFDPNGADPEPPSSHQKLRYQTLENLLECEVVANRLRPHGKHIQGFARRFKLVEVANAAKRIKMGLSVVEQLELIIQLEKIGELPELPYQVERTSKRDTVHRKLIDLITQEKPDIVSALSPRQRASKRRKTPVQALNVQLRMKEGRYIEMFHELYARVFNGEPDYQITDSMLFDDRDALNIKFYRGRSSGSKTRPINER